MKKIILFYIFLVGMAQLYAKVHVFNGDSLVHIPVKSYIEIKNKNLVRQKEDYSCGSASLATILRYYYKQDTSEREILDAVVKSQEITKEKHGLSFLDLSQFASSRGFKPLGLALDIKALKKLKIPVILYVKIRKTEHFTVLKGMDESYAYLADPSLGNTKIRLSKFKKMFYQREDLMYPGKVLAILPLGNNVKLNKNFMKLPKSSNLIENTIRSKIIKN